MQLVIFFVLAAITTVAGIIMVSADNIARSIYSHVLALLGIAGIYLLLYAEFMAGVQVLVYAGGVSIMLLFALMLTKPAKGVIRALDHPRRVPAFITAVVLFGLLSFSIFQAKWPLKVEPSRVMTPEVIGKSMFADYVLPFEIVSVILLVALIGAVVIGVKGREDTDDEE
ncbi:MAG: NADH-quinone oxidoreductase subunit J [bacterium]|nr:NADH-quinone oxidoreductase subunit J [bacterium]